MISRRIKSSAFSMCLSFRHIIFCTLFAVCLLMIFLVFCLQNPQSRCTFAAVSPLCFSGGLFSKRKTLKQMNNYDEKMMGKDPLELAETLLNCVKDMKALLEQKDAQIKELNDKLDILRNDPWASRVTYENVVELIASNEDSAVRDEMRKVFEPMLKKEQVRKLCRDVKRKVKELESADSLEEDFRQHAYGNVFYAPVGQVIEHVERLEPQTW